MADFCIRDGALVCFIPKEYALLIVTPPEAPPEYLVEEARLYMLHPPTKTNSRDLVDWDKSNIEERKEMMRIHEEMSIASPIRTAFYTDILEKQKAYDDFFRPKHG